MRSNRFDGISGTSAGCSSVTREALRISTVSLSLLGGNRRQHHLQVLDVGPQHFHVDGRVAELLGLFLLGFDFHLQLSAPGPSPLPCCC